MLFNVVIADLEEEMGKIKWREIKLGDRRIYTLGYADDIVLLAEDENEMKSMIGRLEEYVEKKKLEVNIDKTKIMRFRKGGGRWGKRDWRWKGRKIKEAKEFTHLDYRLQRNAGHGAQISARVIKTAAVIEEVWGILGKEDLVRTGAEEFGYLIG